MGARGHMQLVSPVTELETFLPNSSYAKSERSQVRDVS